MTKAIYPGTFDPATNGHLDIIERGRRIFDHLVVAVAHNSDKRPLFTVEERLGILRELTREMDNVTIDHFTGMTVHYVRSQQASLILRGMRTMSDFEFEFEMALNNKSFDPEIETVFIMTSVQCSFIRSQIIKEVTRLGGSVSDLVPPIVEKMLREKFPPKGLPQSNP